MKHCGRGPRERDDLDLGFEVGQARADHSLTLSGPAEPRLSPEQKLELEARRAAERDRALEALSAYERDPLHERTLTAQQRLRLRVHAPERLRDADVRAEVVRAHVEATQKEVAAAEAAQVTEKQKAHEVRASEVMTALRQARDRVVPALVARFVAARDAGQMEATSGTDLTLALGQVLAEEVAVTARLPHTVRMARSLGSQVELQIAESVPYSIDCLQGRLGDFLRHEAGTSKDETQAAVPEVEAVVQKLLAAGERVHAEAVERRAARVGAVKRSAEPVPLLAAVREPLERSLARTW